MAECIEWLPTELTLQHYFDRIIPLVNIVGSLFVFFFFWQKVTIVTNNNFIVTEVLESPLKLIPKQKHLSNFKKANS